MTDDTRFGQINSKSLQRLRISLISFNFGKKLIHLLTFCFKTKELKLVKIIDLERICKYPDEEKASNAWELYKEEIKEASDETILLQKEALTYKIYQLETTKNRTFNKYVAYIAIVALVLPLYESELSKLYEYFKNYKIVFVIGLVYTLINLLFFFNEFMKVRGYSRTTFNSVRKSKTPLKELTESIYYEWFTIKSETEFQVTLIKNIEKYMKSFVVISILLLVSNNFEKYLEKGSGNKVIISNNDNSLTTLTHLYDESKSNEDFLRMNDLELTKLKSKLLYNNIDKIIIISNEKTSNYKTLVNFLEMYKGSTAGIIELKDSNSKLISIIVIEED